MRPSKPTGSPVRPYRFVIQALVHASLGAYRTWTTSMGENPEVLLVASCLSRDRNE